MTTIVALHVEETVGDPDEAHVDLVTPKTAIPPNSGEVFAQLVTIAPGFTALVIAGSGEGVALDVQERTGDPDELNALLVTPKTALPNTMPGTNYEAFVFEASNGPVLFIPLVAGQ